ncbi:hypothetical protein EYF80_037656 [Liparis tanakae]|uniref:Uncharacterized protein n=1 Tax=Liparis tanakae TaxID=230148 RepID=A0A4Z2GF30_9TELE|nr:hypothetical protein EYF80_037656 [Liparis tanakae]
MRRAAGSRQQRVGSMFEVLGGREEVRKEGKEGGNLSDAPSQLHASALLVGCGSSAAAVSWYSSRCAAPLRPRSSTATD